MNENAVWYCLLFHFRAMLGQFEEREKPQDEIQIVPFEVRVEGNDGVACAAEPIALIKPLLETVEVPTEEPSETAEIQEKVEESILSQQSTNDLCKQCQWEGCNQVFESFQEFVIHCNQHVLAMDWQESNTCKWTKCWNSHTFQQSDRLIEHIRAHTLEKPWMVS
jgi:hypothetical protein